jgi:hypothetical protein
MPEVLQTSAAQIVIGLAALLILTVIGAYVVLKFRDDSDGSESSAELLTKFREMREEGHIEEHEYRTIRTDLEGKLSMQSSAEPVDSDGFDLYTDSKSASVFSRLPNKLL